MSNDDTAFGRGFRITSGVLLAVAASIAGGAGIIAAMELMTPGIQVLRLPDQSWLVYPPLDGAGQRARFVFDVERWASVGALALASGLLIARLLHQNPTIGLVSTGVMLVLGFLVSDLLAGAMGGFVVVWAVVACFRSALQNSAKGIGEPPFRPLLLAGLFALVVGATPYLRIALLAPSGSFIHDTYITTAGWMALVWVPALFLTLELIDGPDLPPGLSIHAALVTGLAAPAAVYASLFLGLSGMPAGSPDYPDDFAGWHLVRALALVVVFAEVIIFALAAGTIRMMRRWRPHR